jgi:peptidoglycan/xylan/chitin deacetylase (PgdA/CDA1 family)
MRGPDLPRRGLRSKRDDTLVLCYHAVSERWPADLSVTPTAFEAQIRAKLDAGYRGATVTRSQDPEPPSKALVVTFDDGFLSTLTAAAPILKRLGVPATLFVPTDYMGRPGPMAWPGTDRWLTGPHREELQPLSWAQVLALAEDGWEIGSHTCSHPRLTSLDEAELDRELRQSRLTVEGQLGRECGVIAYPYGDVDQRVAEQARKAGYRLGVGLPARWEEPADPMQIPRIGIYHGQGGAKLALKTSPLVRRLRALAGR